MQISTARHSVRGFLLKGRIFLPSLLTLAGGKGRSGWRGGERELLPSTWSPGSNNTHPPHGCGDEDAPPSPRGLLLPCASGWPHCTKPLEQAKVRVSARLRPRGPSRAGSALTHIPRRRRSGLSLRCNRSPPPRRSATKSGPRGRGPEAAARTVERAGRGPSLSALRKAVSVGRCGPLLLLFLSPSCNPHHSHFGQPGSPSQSSSPPSPQSHRLLSAAGDTGWDVLFTSDSASQLASGLASCSLQRPPRCGAGAWRAPPDCACAAPPRLRFHRRAPGAADDWLHRTWASQETNRRARRFPRWPLGVSGRGT